VQAPPKTEAPKQTAKADAPKQNAKPTTPVVKKEPSTNSETSLAKAPTWEDLLPELKFNLFDFKT